MFRSWQRILRRTGWLPVLIILAGVAVAAPAAGPQETRPRQTAPAQAVPAAPLELTIEAIMKGEELVGSAPSEVQWAVDGKTVYFQWKKPGAAKEETYAVSAASQVPVPRLVKPEEFLKLPPLAVSSRPRFRFFGFGGGRDIQLDRARRRAVFAQGGDLYLLDIAKGSALRLTATQVREARPRFTRDEKKIAFQAEDNLFLLSLGDGSLVQLTFFTRMAPRSEPTPDEISKMYIDQQKELFKEFQKEAARPEFREPFPSLAKGPQKKPFFLKVGQRVVSSELSPDEKSVVFLTWESKPGAKPTAVPNYVTESGYMETLDSHPKAAYEGQIIKAGIVKVSTGEVSWIDFGQGDRELRPGFQVIWSPDGKSCLLTASSADRKDEWLFLLDPAEAKTKTVEHVRDEAWVGELGLTNIFWWPDSRSISFISEKNGYAHLYKASLNGPEILPLTEGPFEVKEALLSQDGKKIYLTTSEEDPGETHFYSMPAAGGPRTKTTSLPGQNEVVLSPDETTLAILNSLPNRPEEFFLQSNSPGAKARQVTLSTTEAFRSYPWFDPEIVRFRARDGVDVQARLYTPLRQHPDRPAVIFIHGAGYLQNAHRGWSTYFREYMFHNFLMEQGYFVLDVDYRGSAGYGRDFRAGIYRHMGGKDLDDVVDAAKFLVEKCQVDPGRIGCYGGSYGGFLTLMAMFKAPDVFRAGAALRPVTDWAHYHAAYTADILNLPQKDPEAYKQSSPIYFAEGLRGALLICHGMIDVNVHFQDTVRLAQRLIELGKENWQVAFYPAEDHTFQNASSWADEYKRIFHLFEDNLKKPRN